MSLMAKTLNKMILNRIQPKMERKLRDNQNSFRMARSTTSHILRRILEGAGAKSLPVDIDLRKSWRYGLLLPFEDFTGLWNLQEGSGPDITVLHQHQSPSYYTWWNDGVLWDTGWGSSRRYTGSLPFDHCGELLYALNIGETPGLWFYSSTSLEQEGQG